MLDIGCGIGDFLAFRPGTIGVDVNPRLVAHCRELGLGAFEMPFDKLPLEDDRFDSKVLDNVLEHIAASRHLLAEAHRVLRLGGTLLVGVPGERGYATDSDHKVFYDAGKLEATLASAGFQQRRLIHTPVKSCLLNRWMPQYCLCGTFEAVSVPIRADRKT